MNITPEGDRSPETAIQNAANRGWYKRPKLTIRRAKLTIIVVFVLVLVAQLCLGPNGWLGGRTLAEQGGTITNGSAEGVTPAFLFEPEVPLASLKTVPTWNELEQLLDNPYAVTLCSSWPGLIRNTPGNDQGYPSYCSMITRRQSFLPGGAALPPFLVHPLNYNPTTGERMRLLNPGYAGGNWTFKTIKDPTTGMETNPLIVPTCPPSPLPPNSPYLMTKILAISAGNTRVEPGAHEIDYNSPISADTFRCVPNVEVPETGFLFGGDPGEPPGYSVPATMGTASPLVLRNPQTGAPILPRTPVTPNGGLRKPSLRVPDSGGTANNPNYLVNTEANLAADPTALVPSNENDYVRNRNEAMALGKALFWDMQLGSDGVQSCGTCHFHAGADNRVKNQMNPNHLSGDLTFQTRQPNEELVASDFPFQKLYDPEISGDPACTPAIQATINAGVLENNLPNGGSFTVCDANNTASTSNDVASSMGVHFGLFKDIPAIGTFVTNASGVNVVAPDLRSDNPADNLDPIPGFQGSDGSGHQIRRVEPRNTPTLFLTALNFDNFWDGRARHDFNGGSVFGAADPQSHVFVPNQTATTLVGTRQIIRFSSVGSLTTGPALSEFEMSLLGRNWAKIGKKLLQANVTPLGNQLVSINDSVLGRYSNQGGWACGTLLSSEHSPGSHAVGKPGLCINYRGLVQRAFFPKLWNVTTAHLNGCFTDGNAALHPNQCAPGVKDPFDGYVVTPALGAAAVSNTNQFTQMEANFSLFSGLATQIWGSILMPDNTPFDQFLDGNPDAYAVLGEAGEPGLVRDQPMCTSATQRNCVREVAGFKRDPQPARPGFGGTRQANAPDPLLGLDIFFGSNLSLKNPNFRAGRCGECHAAPTLTDNTMPFTFKAQLADFVAEFQPSQPGIEQPIEPLGRNRLISGFLLESELNENGQDGVEHRIANQSIAPNPDDGLAYPGGLLNPGGSFIGADQGYFDNGVYNLGVTPCKADQAGNIERCDDVGRGGNDAFGWPLSIAALLLKNLGGPNQVPGVPLATFDPSADTECAPECGSGGLFDETAQDQQINPGFNGGVTHPLLPPYLAPWVQEINVGDSAPDLDEINSGINTLTDVAMIEGFGDVLGPFNAAAVVNENLNIGNAPQMGSWPMVNRVGRFGSFKAPQLREVELTGPYFHNGGKLTLRQVVDFYTRGGDFPLTNFNHRDFNIVNLNFEVQSNLTEAEKVALVDFLLTLTDERVRFERAPFDHPEVFVPLDGTAPENSFGRPGFLTALSGVCPGGTGPCFRRVLAVGSAGRATALPNFLGISSGPRLIGAAANCGPAANNHYCH